uniref:Protein-tyrosine sulfotransferase n=1 Tax=Calcidiscus leptoporus TaxID=127549 RepID=A0A7S0P3Q5_9EUKA|mmetsp:Transcript_54176/g.124756  ORF Transcript_54176/g.124756 Transcript_54176/m.124756 type:complete len:243 (+) Transcript_54176:256-984(+)
MDGGLHCIVTGLEYSGTTLLSELVMSAPGLLGPFETGFLLAPTPARFRGVSAYYARAQRSTAPPQRSEASLSLSAEDMEALLHARDHAAMYALAMNRSPLLRGATRFVDNTPRYATQLRAAMSRAPGVPTLVLRRSRADMRAVYRSTPALLLPEEKLATNMRVFERNVAAAEKAFPDRLYEVEYDGHFHDPSTTLPQPSPTSSTRSSTTTSSERCSAATYYSPTRRAPRSSASSACGGSCRF